MPGAEYDDSSRPVDCLGKIADNGVLMIVLVHKR